MKPLSQMTRAELIRIHDGLAAERGLDRWKAKTAHDRTGLALAILRMRRTKPLPKPKAVKGRPSTNGLNRRKATGRRVSAGERALAAALSEIVYYEGKYSGRLVTVEDAPRYNPDHLTSFGNTHSEALTLARDTHPSVTMLDLLAVEKAIRKREPGFTAFTLPQQRTRGVLRHD
jgi:hypothetical protein